MPEFSSFVRGNYDQIRSNVHFINEAAGVIEEINLDVQVILYENI